MLDQSPTGYVGLPVVLLVNMHNKHNVNGECSGRLCRSMWLMLIKNVIIIYSLMVNVHVYSIVMNVIPLLEALIYEKLCSKEMSGIEHFKVSSMQFFLLFKCRLSNFMTLLFSGSLWFQ